MAETSGKKEKKPATSVHEEETIGMRWPMLLNSGPITFAVPMVMIRSDMPGIGRMVHQPAGFQLRFCSCGPRSQKESSSSPSSSSSAQSSSPISSSATATETVAKEDSASSSSSASGKTVTEVEVMFDCCKNDLDVRSMSQPFQISSVLSSNERGSCRLIVDKNGEKDKLSVRYDTICMFCGAEGSSAWSVFGGEEKTKAKAVLKKKAEYKGPIVTFATIWPMVRGMGLTKPLVLAIPMLGHYKGNSNTYDGALMICTCGYLSIMARMSEVDESVIGIKERMIAFQAQIGLNPNPNPTSSDVTASAAQTSDK